MTTRAPLEERLRIVTERQRQALAEADRLESKARTIGNLRGLTFLAFLAGLGAAFSTTSSLGQPLGALLAIASVAAFLGLIRLHDRRLEAESEQRRLAVVLGNAALRLSGRSSELPDTGLDLAQPGHPYAADLDLFGKGSLFQRISTAHTRFGRHVLKDWFLERTNAATARARQATVAELAEHSEFRWSLEQQALGLLLRGTAKPGRNWTGPDPEPLLAWIERPPELLTKRALGVLRLLVPAMTLTGITLQIALGMPSVLWIVPLLVSLVILARTAATCTQAFWAVSHTEGSFLPYGALLALVEGLEARSPHLQALKDELVSHSGPGRRGPSAAMRSFRNIVSWYEVRHNGMLYPFLDALCLWSLNSTWELEKWKRDIGPSIRRWFEIVAEVEALCSFASFLQEDDLATFPELVDAGSALAAQGLGHPLIPPTLRVVNDLPTLAQGQALLVTGSNMSGKSTFLRALGVNAVLGQAGAPVIATAMTLPPLELGTSLRVADSLLDQTSHFFAEVKKLAAVVEATRGERPVLFLLDEVLHGTNSRERQIGARWVLSELLSRGAFGILTTHDEGLCELEGDLVQSVRLFHFREDVTADQMTFDYKLRPGPVTSGNALRLMRAVGLEVPLDSLR